MTTASDEKRRHPRHNIQKPIQATVRARGQTWEGETRDISAGGAALAVDDHTFTVLDDEKIELDIEDVGYMNAQMARNLDDGMAVRFIDLDDDDTENLLGELADLEASIRDEEF